MENLFLKVEDREFGPVSLAELQNLVTEGSFSREDYVWSENMDEWITAENVVELKNVFYKMEGNGHYKQKLYAVASGKGGVGKTIFTSSLGVALATMGQEVVMVDADFGGANLHTCMGILEPAYTFFDFYSLQKDSLNEIVLPTPVDNLKMISGACGSLGIANPKYFQKQRFVRELKKLHADSIILDLGAGSGYNTIDFFLLADEKIIVMTPEPTSVYEAFGFIKVCLIRQLNRRLKSYPAALAILARDEINKPNKVKLTIGNLLAQVQKKDKKAYEIFKTTLDEFRPKLVLNQVRNTADIKEGKAIQGAVLELLCVNLDFLGYISDDKKVKEAVRNMRPFILHAPGSPAGQDLSALIRVNLLGKKGFKEILEKRRWRKHVESYAKEYPVKDLLNNAPICSVNCFYWGDCEYQDGGGACRVRHLEPILSNMATVSETV